MSPIFIDQQLLVFFQAVFSLVPIMTWKRATTLNSPTSETLHLFSEKYSSMPVERYHK